MVGIVYSISNQPQRSAQVQECSNWCSSLFDSVLRLTYMLYMLYMLYAFRRISVEVPVQVLHRKARQNARRRAYRFTIDVMLSDWCATAVHRPFHRVLSFCWWAVDVLSLTCWCFVDNLLMFLLIICWCVVDNLLIFCWYSVDVLLIVCWYFVGKLLIICLALSRSKLIN